MGMLDMDVGDLLKKMTGGSPGESSPSAPQGDEPKNSTQVLSVAAPPSGKEQVTLITRKPFFKHVIGAVCLVAAFGSYLYFQYLPQEAILEEQLTQTRQTSGLRDELTLLQLQAKKAKKDLEVAQQRYEAVTKLFVSEMELEALYDYISAIAIEQDLVIEKIAKGKKIAIDGKGLVQASTNKKAKGAKSPQNLSYYKIPVEITLLGTYGNFVKYRSKIAQLAKTINIDVETVSVAGKEAEGKVRVTTTLSTYRIP